MKILLLEKSLLALSLCGADWDFLFGAGGELWGELWYQRKVLFSPVGVRQHSGECTGCVPLVGSVRHIHREQRMCSPDRIPGWLGINGALKPILFQGRDTFHSPGCSKPGSIPGAPLAGFGVLAALSS